MNGNYLRLAGRIRQETSELQRVIERTQQIWSHAKNATDDYYVDATALNLHGVYAGLERVFEMIADTVDQSKPSGRNRHQELLRQMATEIPGIRPPVFATEMVSLLDKYRGFRHVVRNVYTYILDPAQIQLLIDELDTTLQDALTDLMEFADVME